MTLTKADLVQAVYRNKRPRLSKSQSVEAVEHFLNIAKETLISGEDLLLSGFGKIQCKG